jgi:DNA-binding NtrC family response regulator
MERAVVLSRGMTIDEQDLPLEGATTEAGATTDSLSDVEKAHITSVLAATGGNLSETANRLGIHRNTLRLKMKKYGIGTRC